MRRFITTLFFLFSIVSQSGFAYQLTEFSAIPSDNMIAISWQVQDGADIVKFVLQRSVDEANWADVSELTYIADVSNYDYQDFQVSKKGSSLTTNYYYRLNIHLIDGSVETTSNIMARPKYSGIYRTWGSLKALFR